MTPAAFLLLALAPPGAAPPAPPPAVVASVAPADPARLAAARALLDTLMPPAMRDRMVDDMMRPMMANMSQAMRQSPQMQALLSNDPHTQAVFDRFFQAQLERTTAFVRNGMPGMVEAMSRAYARRFTVAQMREIGAFFATPTGHAYVQQAPTIMTDPDVAAWTRRYMTDAMNDMPAQIETLMKELGAPRKDK